MSLKLSIISDKLLLAGQMQVPSLLKVIALLLPGGGGMLSPINLTQPTSADVTDDKVGNVEGDDSHHHEEHQVQIQVPVEVAGPAEWSVVQIMASSTIFL